MLPLRHNSRTNQNSQPAPPPSLVRKSSRPSLKCKDLPYNGSASYYNNDPPTYLDVPPPPLFTATPIPTSEFRKRVCPTYLQMFDSAPNQLNAPLHRTIQRLPGIYGSGTMGQENYGQSTSGRPTSPMLDQVLTTDLRPGPNVVWFCEKKRGNRKFWTYRNKLLACGMLIFLLFGFFTCQGFGSLTKGARDGYHMEMDEDETVLDIPAPPSVTSSMDTPSPEPLEKVAFTNKTKEKVSAKKLQMKAESEPEMAANVTNGSTIIGAGMEKVAPLRPAVIRIMYSVNEDLESTVEIVEG